MALNDHSERLQEELNKIYDGVLVVNPGKAVIRLTELLVKLGYSHSKRSYPFPPKPIIFNE